MKKSVLFQSSTESRLVAAFGLILLAVSSQQIYLSLSVTLLALLFTRLIDGSWVTAVRLIKLMVWFVVPILLLHLLFSPGRLLFPATGLPITAEGLYHGLLLSARLTAMFSAAILLSRFLSHREWLSATLALPVLGQKFLPYLLMIQPMHQEVSYRLSKLRKQFLLHRHWRVLPAILLTACCEALEAASLVSKVLWLRWPMLRSQQSARRVTGWKGWLLSLLLGISGIACMMLAWI
ncbi:MAG: CbiQ family ECF transporter T component [Mariprofundus sp.]|nr:CbiQ family ECF transporter T component [Mariprofundus sp.]